ncbi:uncharacterized protein TEOVI_000423800 [Trypanosoma equiperdum]|uniref:Uncharacterized protein n=1 Tax=Trypanosoma equiperdum TaxID=5694 RepID=A0A1G4IJI2_TRYEQ|nr:hypothetical protein, conserved [Trypanosoma equiperdum]
MMSSRSVAKVAVAAAIGYVAYRGVLSFFKNEITLSISEVVHMSDGQCRQEIGGQVALKGEILCETYLMRSYRLSMKLSANIKGGTLSLSSHVPSRHRVLHINDVGTYCNVVPSSGSKRRDGLPDIVVDNVHGMVDYWELLSCGNVCFTPPCVSDESVLRYEGKVRPGLSPSATIRDCYLQTDETPGRKRLHFDLIVRDTVHAVSIRIELPNRRCQLVLVDHGGVGSVTRLSKEASHCWAWDIPLFDPRGASREIPTAADEASITKPGSYPHGAMQETLVGALGSDLPEYTPSACTHFMLIFEEQEGGDNSDASTNSDMDGENVEEGFDELKDSPEGSSEMVTSNRAQKVSKKAMKRAERSRKKVTQRQRVDAIRTSRQGAVARGVAVSLSYSVSGLASGMDVRRLRTVSERPNWAPHSNFSRWILSFLSWCIYKPRLGKFAHYTTWFVQTVDVISL